MMWDDLTREEWDGIVEAVRERLARAEQQQRLRAPGETSWWGRLLEKLERMARR
jgi:hypothetical protein